MVGAGQLARMTYQASIPLGVGFRVLADRPDDSAALVCPATTVGDYHRLDDLLSFDVRGAWSSTKPVRTLIGARA